MKICFLTDDSSRIGGGPEHIRQISKILRQKYGCVVDVITPLTMDPKFDFNNFWHRIKFVFWILKFLLVSNCDIYHSHAFSTNIFLPIVKLRGKKTAVTVHGLGNGFWKFFISTLIIKWPYDFKFSAGKLSGFIAVGNGVDIEEFSKIKRRSHKIFTVLCIARRDPAKGVEILEEAVRNLKDVKLHLVFGRRRTMADFAEADLYVLPSFSEGLPIVLLEAMAAKLPIIATDVGDCRRLIEQSKAGVVVPPGDIPALVSAISGMIARKDRDEFGRRGYKFVRENFSWDEVTEKTWEGYH